MENNKQPEGEKKAYSLYKNKQLVYSSTALGNVPSLKTSYKAQSSQILNAKKITVQDFEKKKLLGKGSFGKVELAINIHNGKSYALKILEKKFMNNQDKQHEVHVEKICLSTLSHPNIVKLDYAFQDKHRLYLAIEYCSYRDLGTVLKANGLLDDDLIVFYSAEILSALTYMHSKGIYHRDLKPENIGVDENFHLKILDFGTANYVDKYFDKVTNKFVSIDDPDFIRKVNQSNEQDDKDLEEQEKEKLKEDENLSKSSDDDDFNEENKEYKDLKDSWGLKDSKNNEEYIEELIKREQERYKKKITLTEDYDIKYDNYLIRNLKKEFVGTAEYVSPEVLNHEYSLIGPACDLWSLGVIIYYLFHGKTPFYDKTEELIFDNIRNVKYHINSNIPEEAKDIIEKLLVKNPNERIGIKEGNYDAIKNHPFFKDISFDKLSTTNPPIDKIIFIKKLCGKTEERYSFNQYNYNNGLNDDEVYEEGNKKRGSMNSCNKEEEDANDRKNNKSEIERIENPFLDNNTESTENIDKKNENEIDTGEKKDKIEKDNKELPINKNSEENKLGELLLEEDLLKKSPWLHWNKRHVKLFSNGFIQYIDSKKNKIKGTIELDEYCKVDVINDKQFIVYTYNKKFIFKHKIKNVSEEWYNKINEVISNGYNNK